MTFQTTDVSDIVTFAGQTGGVIEFNECVFRGTSSSKTRIYVNTDVRVDLRDCVLTNTTGTWVVVRVAAAASEVRLFECRVFGQVRVSAGNLELYNSVIHGQSSSSLVLLQIREWRCRVFYRRFGGHHRYYY